MKDERRTPFCWQGIHAMKVLRAHYTGPQRSTAISIYQAFTEIANEHRDRASFQATRKRIAELAGVHVDTLDDYVKGLQGIGLIGCEKHKKGKENLPNTWTLEDPSGVAVSDRQGGGVTPGGGGATPLGGGGLTPAQELNKEEQEQNPLTPLEDEDQDPTPATEEEEAGADPTASPDSPHDSTTSSNGNQENQIEPDLKNPLHGLPASKVKKKMREMRAWDSEIGAVMAHNPPWEALIEWIATRTVPERPAAGTAPRPPRRNGVEQHEANLAKIRSFIRD